jgi:hypothetical protein
LSDNRSTRSGQSVESSLTNLTADFLNSLLMRKACSDCEMSMTTLSGLDMFPLCPAIAGWSSHGNASTDRPQIGSF